MFDELVKLYQGSEVENKMRVVNAMNKYVNFKQKEGEALDHTYDRFTTILNELNRHNIDMKVIEHNMKFLCVLQPEWKKYAHRMKQHSKLDRLPLQEMFEMLKQDEDYAEEKRKKKRKKDQKEKKKVEEEIDSIALMSSKSGKRSSKKDSIGSDEDIDEYESDGLDEAECLKHAMILLTKAFQKQYVKKTASNNQRYASGSKNFEHKDRIESRKKFGEKKDESKREDKKFEEKKVFEKREEEPKCYNCGKTGHFVKECWKPKVRDSNYYKTKMLLAKQKESGKALMAEEEYWLDETDDDEEEETAALAKLCFMSRDTEEAEPELQSETSEIVI